MSGSVEKMSNVTENPEVIQVVQPEDANVINLTSAFRPKNRSAFIILNQPILLPNFKELWDNYELKVCGDGGANRLYNLFTNDEERSKHLPHYIVGDFDSLKPEIRQWYESRGVEVIPQTTQFATDLNKCLDLVEVYYSHKDNGKELRSEDVDPYDGIMQLHNDLKVHNSIQVVLFGAIDGRFDHTIHSITLLFKLSQSNPNLRLYYLSPTDLIFLVPKGVNFIEYKDLKAIHGSNSGLLPLGGPIKLTTKGFKWDVTDWDSSIKGDVSSSNRLVSTNGALIETNDDFIINIELDYEGLDL